MNMRMMFVLTFIGLVFLWMILASNELTPSKRNAVLLPTRKLFCAMVENNMCRENGAPWINPAAFTNSADFIQALFGMRGGTVSDLGGYTNIWCVVVNTPDDDIFPVLFTANINLSELLYGEDGQRRLLLTCPKKWGGECFGFCEKAALLIRKGGAAQLIKKMNVLEKPIFPVDKIVQPEVTFILTPTGRVSFVKR